MALVLAACGRPDASGVYLAKSGREATLVQLVQAKDGAVSGRVEVIGVGADGVMTDQSATLDEAAARRDLAFTRDGLTLRRGGGEVKARKASLADFQKAVSQLKATAAQERRQVVDAQAGPAAQGVQAGTFEAGAFEAPGDRGSRLQTAASALQADAARLDQAVSAAPDFGRQSQDNTARIAELAQRARTLSGADRSRLAASAGQVIVETNQVDLARSRYAIDLDRIVSRAAPAATAVQRFCDSPEASSSGPACAKAKAAATGFQGALVHASVVLKGYKQTIQTELARQNQMIQGMGG